MPSQKKVMLAKNKKDEVRSEYPVLYSADSGSMAPLCSAKAKD